jgi:1,4-alpha-glucan branching enzyme
VKESAQPGLALILHAHLPWVRHAEHPEFLEERWLFEALLESTLPLLMAFERLAADGIPFRIALSLSPPLLEAWADPLLQDRFERHAAALLDLAEREEHRMQDDARWHPAIRHHRCRIQTVADYWKNRCGCNPLRVFLELRDAGRLDLFTTAATHAVLPLYRDDPAALRAQVGLGLAVFAAATGRAAKGFWLPECAYHPGIVPSLVEGGVRYTLLDSHGLLRGAPAPAYGTFAPVSGPDGIAFFARDPECTRRVWSATEGYPGHPEYREFHRDLRELRTRADLGPLAGPPGTSPHTGLKLWRVTGPSGDKQPYRRAAAEACARDHAADFAHTAAARARTAQAVMDRPALLTAPFDAELFGHWWYEGPDWIEALARCAPNAGLDLVTPDDWLDRHPRLQPCAPAESSWGDGGAHAPWLTPENQWMRDGAADAARRLADWMRAPRPPVGSPRDRALQQAARHALLAMASDWPFMVAHRTAAGFAERTVRDQLDRFELLDGMLRDGRVRLRLLQALESLDPLFARIHPAPFFAPAVAGAPECA